MSELKVVSDDDLRAERGMFRPVVMIDSECYRIGADTEDYNMAVLMCAMESRGINPVQVYDDQGRPCLTGGVEEIEFHQGEISTS